MPDGIRIHLGAGTVYLLPEPDGTPWINVDLESHSMRLAKDFPQGVEIHGTTSDRYYGRMSTMEDLLRRGAEIANRETCVCDVYGSWERLPFDDASASEILAVQVFEHLSHAESWRALAEARRVLKPGGILRLYVPDHDGIHREMLTCVERGDTQGFGFLFRQLIGSRKGGWAFHMGSWTQNDLIDFCADWGFEFAGDEPSPHFYPALCLRFTRVAESRHSEFDEQIIPWKAAYEYCGEPLGTALQVPREFKVIEIGPGRGRWPRANCYVDCDELVLSRIKDEFREMPGVEWPEFLHAPVENLSPIRDKSYDFTFVSHCLEHSRDPEKAVAEINRVTKHGGCIVCPSAWKEGLFASHELDHRWWVMKSGDALLFKKIPPGMYENLYSADVSGQVHRMLRYGDPRLGALSVTARKWFHEKEPYMDVIHSWSGELKAMVIE